MKQFSEEILQYIFYAETVQQRNISLRYVIPTLSLLVCYFEKIIIDPLYIGEAPTCYVSSPLLSTKK